LRDVTEAGFHRTESGDDAPDDYYGLKSELPHGAGTTREWIRKHARAELECDLAALPDTISHWDAHKVRLTSPRRGDLALQTEFSVTGHIAQHLDTFSSTELTAMHYVTEFNARWVQFRELLVGVRVLGTGEPACIRTVALSPAWTDGIIGETIWQMPSWADQALHADRQIEVALRLDAHDDAWRSGDVDARMATIEDDTCTVIRVAEVNGGRRDRILARTTEELRSAWSRAEGGTVRDLERLHHCVTPWYAFGFYRVRLDLPDRTVARETASLFPIGPTHKFIGELSYSMQIAV
jgi:hypothetical protein